MSIVAEFFIRPAGSDFVVVLNTGHDLQFHGPFASVEEASANLRLWKAEWNRTAAIRKTYARAIEKHSKLIRRRTPTRAAKIREELAGFEPPPPPLEPTAEAVRSWQVQARRAANRYRRARAAKAVQAKAVQAAKTSKAAKADARTLYIRAQWLAAADIPERRRAAHVARLTGVTSRYVRMVMSRT